MERPGKTTNKEQKDTESSTLIIWQFHLSSRYHLVYEGFSVGAAHTNYKLHLGTVLEGNEPDTFRYTRDETKQDFEILLDYG